MIIQWSKVRTIRKVRQNISKIRILFRECAKAVCSQALSWWKVMPSNSAERPLLNDWVAHSIWHQWFGSSLGAAHNKPLPWYPPIRYKASFFFGLRVKSGFSSNLRTTILRSPGLLALYVIVDDPLFVSEMRRFRALYQEEFLGFLWSSDASLRPSNLWFCPCSLFADDPIAPRL